MNTYWVSRLQQVLDSQLTEGHRASALARAGLEQLLDDLDDKALVLVRGDSGYGNEGILVTFEQRQ